MSHRKSSKGKKTTSKKSGGRGSNSGRTDEKWYNRDNKRSGKPQKDKKSSKGSNQLHESVECKGLSVEGKGLVTISNKSYEVDNLLPGEKANIRMKYAKAGRYAELEKVVKASDDRVNPKCPVYYECGGCHLQHMDYNAQSKFKEDTVRNLMKKHCKIESLVSMDHPYDYRNKAHATFGFTKDRRVISGMYAARSHDLIPIERCIIQDPIADAIAETIRKLMKSFKMEPYNEDIRSGFLRHILVRVGKRSGQVMVVLVGASPVFKGKKNFVKALCEAHPEINTIIFNINDKKTSMVLGERESVLYGNGKITDELCGLEFEISSKSFYQINPPQTEKLYDLAIEMAHLTGKETVFDAYCGTGTIGLIASRNAGKVIGVELNADAVKDAVRNAKRNQISNVEFHQADASEFMMKMAAKRKKVDVVIMDPPRSGSTDVFIDSVAKLSPKRVVYVSCNPVTLARDLDVFAKKGYKAKRVVPVDMFPQTYHVETVVELFRV